MTDHDSCFGHSFILIIITNHYEIPQPRIFFTKYFYFNINEKHFASDEISMQVSYLSSKAKDETL
jgi:hypothetical protein